MEVINKMRALELCRRLAAAGLLLLTAGVVRAEPNIRVLALFPGKAMLAVDGSNTLLAEGETGPAGIRLISASSKQAVIDIDGRRQSFGLGDHIGGSYAAPELAEARIQRNSQGAFISDGVINGRRVRMMVDTGATVVALNSADADRLDIDYENDGRPSMVTTASGTVPAYALTLDRVRIGNIEQRNVQAVVMSGGHPPLVLLGQTFLRRVKIQDRGNLMVLQAKY